MVRTTKTLVALAFTVAALGLGCAHGKAAEGGGQALEPGAYMPLAVGNSWTYDRDYLGEKGEHTVQITRVEDGFYVDTAGGALRVDAFGVRDHNRYLLRSPVESGREWNNIVSVSSMERYKILDVGFTCETPAGTFKDCVRVEARNRIDPKKTMVNEITFAPGVGMVQFDLFLQTDDKRIPQGRIVLKRYTVAGAPAPAPGGANAG